MAHKLEEKARTEDILIKEDYTFNTFFLPDKILQGLKDAGFYRPSPIQLKAIPLGRCGFDLIVKAKSGTGKTLVFTVLALEVLDLSVSTPQVIILAPTREIAVQIEDVTKSLGKHFEGLKIGCFIGGLPIEDDIKKLKACHIAIGAPGRMKALIERKSLNTSNVRLLVLDEADKLMEKSFRPDINYIYNELPQRKQVLAVSATYVDELDKFLGKYMDSPTFVTPEVSNSLLLGLQQFVSIVKEHPNIMNQIEIKTNELVRLFNEVPFSQCIVFFNFQTRAETLSHLLGRHGWNASYLTGSQSQKARLNVLNSFKKFQCRILLTTDLSARGIDVSNVDLVINFEVPFEAVTYLHRMGRAGRYGSHGICLSISSEGRELYEFQKILGQVGGSELSVPKVPASLGGIRSCSVNDLEKVQGLVVDSEGNKDIKQTVVDIKVVKNNQEKRKVQYEHPAVEEENVFTQKTTEPNTSELVSEECISAHILYPWVPSNTSVLSKAPGQNLIEDFEMEEDTESEDISEQTNLTISKNIALYNSAQLLTSPNLHHSEDLAKSVGNYFNVLKHENKKREKEMEKFFESYSCEDMLKNLAEHTEAWSNAESVKEPSSKIFSLPKENKEDLFSISYNFITKKNQMPWTDVVSDYCSSEDEIEENEDYECWPSEDISATEEDGDVEFIESTWTAPDMTALNYYSNEQNDYYNSHSFTHLYDECFQEMNNYTGISDEASVNEWCDNWHKKVSSVTNYVQGNIDAYSKSQYQQAMQFNYL